MRTLIALLTAAALLLIAAPVGARNVHSELLDDVTVSTVGGAYSVTRSVPDGTSAYLLYTTSSEVNDASLTVTVSNTLGASDFVICTGTAVTTETTNVMLIGSQAAGAAEGIGDACDYPLAANVKFTFTVTGATASFDIDADVAFLHAPAP